MSELFVVATPIGNLEDISYRAVRVLGEVDVIACEDTRHSQRLLGRYAIKKQLISCHGYNEAQSAQRIITALGQGKSVAYLSDAGTPCLSDPGAVLVEAVRKAGYRVTPLPGPSAFATLLSAAGVVGKTVTFEGFLSPRPGRRDSRLKELLERNEAFVLYESVHRVHKLLAALDGLAPERQVVLGRELTKQFEDIQCSTSAELLQNLEARSAWKGEFTLLVLGSKKD